MPSISISIVSVILLFQFIVTTPYEIDDISIDSDPQILVGNEIMSERYKNKTITIIPFSERNMGSLTIEGISIQVVEYNGTYYTPILPYNSYNSLMTMAQDIINSIPLDKSNQSLSRDYALY